MATSLEVGGWRTELEGLLARFGRLFVRAEPREQAGRYLEGLLAPVERKNGWQLAEAIGDARPWRTQRVLGHALWDEAAACDLRREHAVGRLGAEDAVLVVDETAFVKKGEHSAGVARQYCGTLGKVENCQVGVFAASAILILTSRGVQGCQSTPTSLRWRSPKHQGGSDDELLKFR